MSLKTLGSLKVMIQTNMYIHVYCFHSECYQHPDHHFSGVVDQIIYTCRVIFVCVDPQKAQITVFSDVTVLPLDESFSRFTESVVLLSQ